MLLSKYICEKKLIVIQIGKQILKFSLKQPLKTASAKLNMRLISICFFEVLPFCGVSECRKTSLLFHIRQSWYYFNALQLYSPNPSLINKKGTFKYSFLAYTYLFYLIRNDINVDLMDFPFPVSNLQQIRM